jgi:hypothetical protein
MLVNMLMYLNYSLHHRVQIVRHRLPTRAEPAVSCQSRCKQRKPTHLSAPRRIGDRMSEKHLIG